MIEQTAAALDIEEPRAAVLKSSLFFEVAPPITLPHFSVSSAMSLPNWASVIGIGMPPSGPNLTFGFA